MTIEEKAKAYDEALERAKATINVNPSRQNEVTNLMVTIFPELAESEDERIRKMIVKVVEHHGDDTNISVEDEEAMFAWLEKHKEQKPIEFTPNQFDGITYGMGGHSTDKPAEWSEDERIRKELLADIPKVFPYDKAFRYIAYLEKQKEQKPIEQNASPMIDSALNDYVCKVYAALDKENGGVLSFARLQHLAMDIQKWCDEQRKSAEWGDEDDFQLREAIEAVLETDYSDERKTDVITWLKSLPFKSKIDNVEYERGYLAGQGSVTHWKPSEEQMYMLNWLQLGLGDGPVAEKARSVMESLYNDLKKL